MSLLPHARVVYQRQVRMDVYLIVERRGGATFRTAHIAQVWVPIGTRRLTDDPDIELAHTSRQARTMSYEETSPTSV